MFINVSQFLEAQDAPEEILKKRYKITYLKTLFDVLIICQCRDTTFLWPNEQKPTSGSSSDQPYDIPFRFITLTDSMQHGGRRRGGTVRCGGGGGGGSGTTAVTCEGLIRRRLDPTRAAATGTTALWAWRSRCGAADGRMWLIPRLL